MDDNFYVYLLFSFILGYLFNSIIKKMCGTNIEGFRSLTGDEEDIIDKIITGKEVFTMDKPEIGSLNNIYGTIDADARPESPCDSKKYCYYDGTVRGSDGLYPGLPAFKTYTWSGSAAEVDNKTRGPIECNDPFDCCNTSKGCTRVTKGMGKTSSRWKRARDELIGSGFQCKPQQCSVQGKLANCEPGDSPEDPGVCPLKPQTSGNDENNQKESNGEKNRVVKEQVTCNLAEKQRCPGPINVNGDPTDQDCPESEACPLLCTIGHNAINLSDPEGKEKNYQCKPGWVPRPNTYYTPSTDPRNTDAEKTCCIETCDNWIKNTYKGGKCPAGSHTHPGTIPFDSKGSPQPEKCCEYATEDEIINNNGKYVCDPNKPKESKCLLCNQYRETQPKPPHEINLGAIHNVPVSRFILSDRLQQRPSKKGEFKRNMNKWNESTRFWNDPSPVYGYLNGVNVNWEIKAEVKPYAGYKCRAGCTDWSWWKCDRCGERKAKAAVPGIKSYLGAEYNVADPNKRQKRDKCVTRQYLEKQRIKK